MQALSCSTSELLSLVHVQMANRALFPLPMRRPEAAAEDAGGRKRRQGAPAGAGEPDAAAEEGTPATRLRLKLPAPAPRQGQARACVHACMHVCAPASSGRPRPANAWVAP